MVKYKMALNGQFNVLYQYVYMLKAFMSLFVWNLYFDDECKGLQPS